MSLKELMELLEMMIYASLPQPLSISLPAVDSFTQAGEPSLVFNNNSNPSLQTTSFGSIPSRS